MSFFTEDFSGKDYFKKIEFDHVEFYSGNAKQSAYFYRNAFGFDLIAYKGPETSETDRVSYVLKKNKVFFVISSPLLPEDEITDWISKHGDGVYNIAFKVDSVKEAYNGCIARGAISVSDNTYKCDEEGVVIPLKKLCFLMKIPEQDFFATEKFLFKKIQYIRGVNFEKKCDSIFSCLQIFDPKK